MVSAICVRDAGRFVLSELETVSFGDRTADTCMVIPGPIGPKMARQLSSSTFSSAFSRIPDFYLKRVYGRPNILREVNEECASCAVIRILVSCSFWLRRRAPKHELLTDQIGCEC